METLIQDVRFSFRRLLKNPGFTVIALLSLALGIGANSSIFSLVNTVLLRPLNAARPEQLVEVYGTLHNGADETIVSYQNYKDYRDRNEVFAGLLGYRFAPMSLSHGGNNERVWGYLVSGNYFDVLGIKAAQGRTFLDEEDRTPGSHPVAVMSYGCWQRRFGADPSLVGKNVQLNGHAFTIIGIAPKDFKGTEVAYSPELWVPFMMDEQIEPGSDWLTRRGDDNIFVLGRLKPGVTQAQAESSLQAITLQLAKEYPDDNAGRGVKLLPPGLFLPSIRRTVIGFAGVLMAVVGLLLLIACVNLANLLLARATERRKEIAIRLAIGASRARLMRQLLTESVLLSVCGGVLGVLFALWITDLVASTKLPTDIALSFDIGVDWRVLVFTFLLSLVTGIIFGLLPALQSSNPNLVSSLKSDETGAGGFRRSHLRDALVVAQVALSLLLLISTGLIVRSLQRAQSMNPGFNPANAVAVSFDVGLQGYDETKGRAFQQQAIERVSALPGVQAVALASYLPLSLNFNYTGVYIEGQPFNGGSNLPIVIPANVSPNYFKTMSINLRGRDFTAHDKEKESRVAIVNETFARRFFPGGEAIGKRFNFGGPSDPYWEVIGVAADGKYNSLGEQPMPLVYRPLFRNYESTATLVARTTSDPQATIGGIRNEIHNLDPDLPLYEVKTLTEHMSIPLFPARVAALVLGSFGVIALLLAAFGIYGVMSYVVSQRTHEIGIRMALGAQAGDVLRLVVRQGMWLALIGMCIGLIAAFALTRIMSSLLYGVSATDPVTFAGVSLVLAVVAFVACLLPARRATKVDPMIALRYE